jgi:predicted dehydrogenase
MPPRLPEGVGIVEHLSPSATELPVHRSCASLIAAGLDAAIVAVPTSAHHVVAAELISAGIHVLVEKPLAPDITEAEDLTRLAQAHGIVLMVGHIERFNPAVRAIAEAVDPASIAAMELTRVGPRPDRIKDAGVLVDAAIHDSDLVRWLARSEISEHQAMVAGPTDGHEELAFLQLRTASVVASIRADWLSRARDRTLIVKTADRVLIGDLLRHTAAEQDRDGQLRQLTTAAVDALTAELSAFLSAVRGEAPNPVPGVDGLRSLTVALQCLEAARRR